MAEDSELWWWNLNASIAVVAGTGLIRMVKDEQAFSGTERVDALRHGLALVEYWEAVNEARESDKDLAKAKDAMVWVANRFGTLWS